MFHNVPMTLAITMDKIRFLISDSISSESTDFSTRYLGRRGGVEVNMGNRFSLWAFPFFSPHLMDISIWNICNKSINMIGKLLQIRKWEGSLPPPPKNA